MKVEFVYYCAAYCGECLIGRDRGRAGNAARTNVAGKLAGGAMALDAYGALSAGKPVAAGASSVGLPGSLPRLGADVPPSILKKSII